LREAGMRVIGIGEKKTPNPFITACDKFIYIEILAEHEPAEENIKNKKARSVSFQKIDKSVIKLIRSSINDLADESGWAFLGEIGNLILKKQPNFDPRNYGFKKLMPLIKSLNQFETDERQTDKDSIKHVYVKAK
jgi:Fe-S-cluster formation regulator IscX/YfhJ